ncbi:thermonuclease family protein [Temperatibacter marinus]|uniref:Thermonuclease family protein n=1 Tax=Temperatibacter marinus TaxID=1456591 RepID=A0AA52EHU7_9PROT|nr:thermonuclease family protein [Temperatibacter marinus]WND03438.1 thermonuclease family protein [Temperatibacter marinus]
MKLLTVFSLFSFSILHITQANLPPLADRLTRCGTGTAAKAISGDRFILKSGESIKLAAIKAPMLFYKDVGTVDRDRSWPYAVAARHALDRLIKNKALIFYCEGRRKDYQGRLVVYPALRDAPNDLLNHTMVQQGFAWTYPYSGQKKAAFYFYKVEETARKNQRGLWNHKPYRPKAASQVQTIPYHSFETIIGVVHKSARRGPYVYLNFSEQIYEDFTLKVPINFIPHYFNTDRLTSNPNKDYFKGIKIMVRGWTEKKGGPLITVDQKDRLIILSRQKI